MVKGAIKIYKYYSTLFYNGVESPAHYDAKPPIGEYEEGYFMTQSDLEATLREAFEKGREKIKHPDWDYVYESADEYIASLNNMGAGERNPSKPNEI